MTSFEMIEGEAAMFWLAIALIIVLTFCNRTLERVKDKTVKKLLRVLIIVESSGFWALGMTVACGQWKAGYYTSGAAYSILLVILPVAVYRWFILPPKTQGDDEGEKADGDREP